MKNFFSVAPGAIWAALILGLSLGAMFLNDYMGDVVPVWLPPLILTVIVPLLKIFGQDNLPASRAVGGSGRSRLSRWLL